MVSKIIIKKGQLVLIEIPVSTVATVDETPDGVVVNLKDKSFLTIIDTLLPTTSKQKVKASVENFKIKKGNIEVDLNNHENPVKVNL